MACLWIASIRESRPILVWSNSTAFAELFAEMIRLSKASFFASNYLKKAFSSGNIFRPRLLADRLPR